MDTCSEDNIISQFDYETQRRKKMDEIKTYYNTVLSDYTNKYYDYAHKKSTNNPDDWDNANYLMSEKGDIIKLNNELVNIKTDLNQMILNDYEDIKLKLKEL